MKEISVLNYGSGNVFSLLNALKFVGFKVKLIGSANEILSADDLLLPGVGAFPNCMRLLSKIDCVVPLIEHAKAQKKMLGICVGMQVLFEKGYEFGCHNGLGIIKGDVRKISSRSLKGERLLVPHIGWSSLKECSEKPAANAYSQHFFEQAGGAEYYFVHSFLAKPKYSYDTYCIAEYGDVMVPAVVGTGNTIGVQFHPEKSGEAGLSFLEYWGNA